MKSRELKARELVRLHTLSLEKFDIYWEDQRINEQGLGLGMVSNNITPIALQYSSVFSIKPVQSCSRVMKKTLDGFQ